jgi:hypothetical protein
MIMACGDRKDELELKNWFGLTPSGMEKHLRAELSDYLATENWSDADIKRRAYELCFNPSLHACFDQKGHAIGGAGQDMRHVVVGMCGQRKDRRDTPDSRWLSVCPMTMGDGKLGFVAFVVQGTIVINSELEKKSDSRRRARMADPSSLASLDYEHDDTHHEAEPDEIPSLGSVLYGLHDTILATSKTGYSNNAIHLRQFEIGIARLKEKHPELFPMMLWLDGWSGHLSLPFKKFCKQQGIILMQFRSHSTMWACPLDNGPFAEYEKVYNKAILRERSQWRGKGWLPFALVMRAVKTACDAAFEKDVVKASFTKTLFTTLTASALEAELLPFAQADDTADATDAPVMICTRSPHGNGTPSAIPAFRFDPELPLRRMTLLADGGFKSADHDGAGRDVHRAKQQEKKQAVKRETLRMSKELIDDINAKGLYTVPRGVDPVMVTDPSSEYVGQHLCYKCRIDCARNKENAKVHKWAGSCLTLAADIEKHEEEESTKQANKEQKERDRAEKEQVAAERKAVEDAKREDLLVKVGALGTILSEVKATTTDDGTPSELARHIDNIEAAASGLSRNQHKVVAEARELVESLKEKKKRLVAAEQAEKKRKRTADEESRRQARIMEREEKRRKDGEEILQWTRQLLVAADATGKEAAVRKALEAILREDRRVRGDSSPQTQ